MTACLRLFSPVAQIFNLLQRRFATCKAPTGSGKGLANRRSICYASPVRAKPRPSAKPVSPRSESTEDHLERIQELVEQKGYARVSDIAVSLRLSRSAVSNMVRRLAARGFVNYERYRGFTLTAQGRAVAIHVKVRHQTLAELFQLLGLGSETVEQEVEVIEHHLRPETLRVFSQLVRFWQDNPQSLAAFLEYKRDHSRR